MPAKPKSNNVQTTVRLPKSLYDQAKRLLEAKPTGATSLNDFIITALSAYVKLLRRKQIDAAFAGMSEDGSYQKEAQLLAVEFEQSDWEALEIAEKESAEGHAAR